MDRLPRRAMLAAIGACPSVPAPEGGGGAPAPAAPGAPLQPPIPAPVPAPPPGAPAAAPPAPAPPSDPIEKDSDADATPPRRITQARLSSMLTREKAEGGRALVRERFGVDKLEDLDVIVAAGRAAQRAALPADQQASAELAEERRLRQLSDARLVEVQDNSRISDVLFRSSCTLPAAALAELRADGLAVGADAYAIQAAVDRLKVRAPSLFTAAPPAVLPTVGQPGYVAPAPGAPAPAPPLPAGDPGAPPAVAPPPPSTGFGSRGRAEAARRFPEAKPAGT